MYAIKKLKESKMPIIPKKIYSRLFNCGKVDDEKEIKIDPIKKIKSTITKIRTTSFLVGDPIMACSDLVFLRGEQFKHTNFFPTLLMQFGQTNFLHLSHLNQLSDNGAPGLLHTGHQSPAYGEGSDIDNLFGVFIPSTTFY
jgi:hypothetical protein